ncbi:MAG: RNA 2',3'-cyclic phosphodiesterase, partial [Armatimonadota bacterium]|nr:RNA 2',3'-cyclic phosphodiesterase [Armatimonadota bacterium]
MRLFVAIPLDPALRPAAQRVRDEIVRLCPEAATGVKWVEPHNLHFTLKFLGEVPDAKVPEVAASLGRLRECEAFEIRIEGVGAFPTSSSPRVVWVGVFEGADRLTALAARAEEILAEVGFAREARPFSAHLTLGRARERRRLPCLKVALEAQRHTKIGVQ